MNKTKLVCIISLFLLCCLPTNGQDYKQMADACYEKGDYECAKTNYNNYQTVSLLDMSEQIKKADDCYKMLITANDYFKEKEYEKAKDRYEALLEKNPKDTFAKKQVNLCITALNRSTPDQSNYQVSTPEKPTSQLSSKNSRFANYTETINQLNIEMIAVQGGTFTMGRTAEQSSDYESDEMPSHRVTLSDFYIGKYEITQAQWKAVMGNNPSAFIDDNYPVENVSWNDIQTFITRLNNKTGKQYRLPTEAEWEFAARGGTSSRGYKYSGSNTAGHVAWYSDNSKKNTHAVGTKSPNELGIYDMSGNVWEWCSDWYGSYSSSAQTNPTGPASGSRHVFRGGSWNYAAKYTRVSYRTNRAPDNRNDSIFRRNANHDILIGFRLACSSK